MIKSPLDGTEIINFVHTTSNQNSGSTTVQDIVNLVPKAKDLFNLPVPSVKLLNNVSGNINIIYGSDTDKYSLVKYPIVIALDLSKEQIDEGVYVEMSHYVKAKRGEGAGYVVPAPQVGGGNPLGNTWTRGGSYSKFDPVTLGSIVDSADRPNHYRVTTQNEKIPVYEYLNNRHVLRSISYFDNTGADAIVDAIVPAQGISTVPNRPGKTFMYSSQYRPYYFMFRYVMWNKDINNWVSGGWSRVIKLTNEEHPFHVDSQHSAIFGRQVGTISPLYNLKVFKCWFETRLP